MDANAAASWANTPSGQIALALDRAGSLGLVTRCTGQGWKVETIGGRRFCMAFPAQDGKTHGWALP